MTTPLYPTFQKRIDDSFESLIRNRVTPWAFLNSGKPMRVQTHDKKQIAYEGVGFEGSPERVFWSRYIEPFMEDICINEISTAVRMAEERNVDATSLLPEVEGLLLAGIRKTFSEMAKIDQRLKGRGFPEKVPLRCTENEFQKMKGFAEVRIQAELELWKPRSKFEKWFERNKAVVWIIGIVLVLIGYMRSSPNMFSDPAASLSGARLVVVQKGR